MEPRRIASDRQISSASIRKPLYQQLGEQIASDIAKQRFRPGDHLPTEPELAVLHGVAVGTVRKAVDLLVGEGLVERVHGSGTFIRRPDFGTAFVRFIRYFGSAGDRRMPTSRILARKTMSGPCEVTDALCLSRKAEVIWLHRLRIHDGLPVLIEEIWLEKDRFGPILTMNDLEPQLLYPLYERLCGEVVACAEETITIEAATEGDAQHLGMIVGRPVVIIDRLALGYNKRPIEFRRSRGPASDFRYKIEIR